MIDDNDLHKVKCQIEDNSDRITKIVDKVVAKYNEDLDDFIRVTKEKIERKNKLSISDIENMVLKVPIYQYLSSSGVEDIGIMWDNAKAIKDTKYNDKYIETCGTIGDKTAEADNTIITEKLMSVVYERAYKKLKKKLEICDNICRAANKVLQSRITDMEISNKDKGYINEREEKVK